MLYGDAIELQFTFGSRQIPGMEIFKTAAKILECHEKMQFTFHHFLTVVISRVKANTCSKSSITVALITFSAQRH